MEAPADPKTDPNPEPKNPEAPESPPVGQAPPKPPPAAEIVLKGSKNEKDVALERTLKERETRIAELEDENRTLKAPTPAPAPPTPAKKRSWLKGWTLLDADEEA